MSTVYKELVERIRGELHDLERRDNALCLDEFRQFRHLVRNVYTTNLRLGKMAGLMSALTDLWSRLRGELHAFADFLEELAQT